MKDDSIATVINTRDFSNVDSSDSAKNTIYDPVAARRAENDNTSGWERLDDTKIPGKTWDYVVAHTSSSRKRGARDTSDNK